MRSLAEWVEAEIDPVRGLVRQGMHAVMLATARLDGRFPAMVMKGGVLMAVRYGSARFTTDVDYSTTARLDQMDVAMFIGDLAVCLQREADALGYDMACRIQGHRVNPPRPEATFPTLQVKVGVARLSRAPELRRLHAGMAPHAFSIDYSFNEWPAATEVIAVDQGTPIQAYDLTDLIAEKYRSLLQQTVRNRTRYQDVYDLHLLLAGCGEIDGVLCAAVLAKLLRSAEGKLPVPTGMEMRDEGLIARTRERYSELEQLVDAPPPFMVAYEAVRVFYEALPWPAPRAPVPAPAAGSAG